MNHFFFNTNIRISDFNPLKQNKIYAIGKRDNIFSLLALSIIFILFFSFTGVAANYRSALDKNNYVLALKGGSITASASTSANASTPCTNDGSITIIADGGDGTSYYYFVVTGPVSAVAYCASGTVIDGLSYGYYNIMVYDAYNPGDGLQGYATAYLDYNSSNCTSTIYSWVYGESGASSDCSSDGSLYLYSSGGDGNNNYTYSAYNTDNGLTYSGSGGNYGTLTGLTPGNYTITVSDFADPNDGFTTVVSGYVGSNGSCNGGNPIYAYVIGSNTTDPCTNDGSVSIYASGGDGTGYYYFVITGPVNTVAYGGSGTIISGLSYGYYSIMVYDAGNTSDGLQGYADYYVSYNNWNCASSIYSYAYTSSNASSDCSSDGSLYLYASGGDGNNNYTYSAYNTDNGQTYSGSGGNYGTLTGLTPGNYTITVSDFADPNDGFATVVSGYVGSNGSCNGSNPIYAYATGNNATDPCTNNGSITVYAYNGDGTGYYYFVITGPVSTVAYGGSGTIISGLSYGYYSIMVYDANNTSDGLQGYAGYYVSYNNWNCASSIYSYAYTSSNASSDCSSDGSLYLYASGGDGNNNYNYSAYNTDDGQTYTGGGGNYGTLTGLTPGNYTITVSDFTDPNDGFATVVSGYVGSNGSCNGGNPIYAYVTGSNTTDPCTNDGSVSIYASGGDGTGYYYFVITGPVNTVAYGGLGTIISGLSYGYYSIMVYDAGNTSDGLQGYTDYYVSYNNWNCASSIYSYAYTSSNASSDCSSDGSLYLYSSGGDGNNNYTYSAYNTDNGLTYSGSGGNYGTLTGLTPGNYTITVSDFADPNDGFTTVVSGYVGSNGSCNGGNPIYAYVIGSNTTDPCTNDGSVSIYASGGDGTGYYYFVITGPVNTVAYGGSGTIISGLSYGYYSIMVYDAGNTSDGLQGYADYYVSYNNWNCASSIYSYAYTSSNASSDCSSDGSLYLYASGGDGNNNYTYSAYNTDNGQTYSGSGGNYGTLTGLTPGNYTITVSDFADPNDGFATVVSGYVGSNGSCNGSNPIYAYVTGNSNATNPCANDGSITLFIYGGDGNNNYIYIAYNSDNGQTYSGSINNYGILSNLTPGNYTITISDGNNPNDGFSVIISANVGTNASGCRMDEPVANEDTGSKDEVLIYPNPALDHFFVEINQTDLGSATVKIEIINALGQILQIEMRDINEGHLIRTLNISEGLTTGIYFVRTSLEGNVFVNQLSIVK